MEENEVLVDMMRDLFGKEKHYYSSKGQISFNCPYCDDGKNKGNLEININEHVYKCWSCAETNNTHGSIYKLIKKHGNQKHLKRYELLKPEDVEFVQPIKKEVKLPIEFVPLNDVSLGMKLSHHYKQAMTYLRKRNNKDGLIL